MAAQHMVQTLWEFGLGLASVWPRFDWFGFGLGLRVGTSAAPFAVPALPVIRLHLGAQWHSWNFECARAKSLSLSVARPASAQPSPPAVHNDRHMAIGPHSPYTFTCPTQAKPKRSPSETQAQPKRSPNETQVNRRQHPSKTNAEPKPNPAETNAKPKPNPGETHAKP